MMKNRKKQPIWVLILFLGFLVTGLWVNERTTEVNPHLYVFTCKPYGTHFTIQAMEQMKEAGYAVGYYAEAKLPAQSYRTQKQVRIVGTNEDYPYLAERKMKEGAWFNGLHAERQSQIAILNEAAAMEFFGTTQAQLNQLQIDGLEYTVLGVVQETNEEAVIYLPYKNLKNCHHLEQGIQQVFSRMENTSEAKLLLQLSGMEEQEIELFSMSEYQSAARIRWWLILFLIGLLLAVWLWKGIRKEIEIIRKQGSEFLKTHYGVEVWQLCLNKMFCTEMIRLVSRGILVVCLGYLVFQSANFNIGTGKYMIQMGVQVPEFSNLEIWNRISLWLFFFTVLTGIILWKEWFTKYSNN